MPPFPVLPPLPTPDDILAGVINVFAAGSYLLSAPAGLIGDLITAAGSLLP
ncbi:hypothetical protein [Corynebacterium sp. CNJ-954]|uniref:hypothetical protein n=1 Tax=Corynebacterium sp. CNJ-954 TaxID=1904962 RepID=UPI000AD9B6C9|nr:hypothetical protein [Corynebacterium sp. CNJ-954]